MQLLVTLYLSPKDHVFSLVPLSRFWKKYAKDPRIWTYLDKVRPLLVGERLQILQCLVERRSKGKLYIAMDRIT